MIVKLLLDRDPIWLLSAVGKKHGIVPEPGRNMAAETRGRIAKEIPVAGERNLKGEECGGNVMRTRSEEGTILG